MFFEMNNAEINLTKWYKFKYVRFPYGYTAVITNRVSYSSIDLCF
uniref:Uncharacterized protein n=1 Tax=Anguilla anguilla TaxID=7936 RepID=A0A0E9QW21_ANGAN